MSAVLYKGMTGVWLYGTCDAALCEAGERLTRWMRQQWPDRVPLPVNLMQVTVDQKLEPSVDAFDVAIISDEDFSGIDDLRPVTTRSLRMLREDDEPFWGLSIHEPFQAAMAAAPLLPEVEEAVRARNTAPRCDCEEKLFDVRHIPLGIQLVGTDLATLQRGRRDLMNCLRLGYPSRPLPAIALRFEATLMTFEPRPHYYVILLISDEDDRDALGSLMAEDYDNVVEASDPEATIDFTHLPFTRVHELMMAGQCVCSERAAKRSRSPPNKLVEDVQPAPKRRRILHRPVVDERDDDDDDEVKGNEV